MFSYVTAHLPSLIDSQVLGIIDPMPTDSQYGKRKSTVLKRTTAFDEARLHMLLTGIELENRSPFLLLRHMRSLVGPSTLDDPILLQIWTNCFPLNAAAVLAILADELPLDKLSEAADKTYERFFKSAVNNVTGLITSLYGSTALDASGQFLSQLELAMSHVGRERPANCRFNSRSMRRDEFRTRRSRSYCYFHRRFSNAAGNCRPGCKYRKTFLVSRQETITSASDGYSSC
ncbi:unnamed protein product [Dicrocoelium dendriticum]|nr:unnamed protein product [Dicrocoelium dendriticum]